MEDIVEISFKCPIRPQVKLVDLKSKPKYTTHTIVEQIKWINSKVTYQDCKQKDGSYMKKTRMQSRDCQRNTSLATVSVGTLD